MGFNDLTARILEHSKNAFGEEIEYRPKDGSIESIVGIFDEAFFEVDVDGEAGTQSQIPMLGIKLSDLVDEPKEGDSIVARDREYRVITVEKDGRGGARLLLHKLR